MKKLILLAFLAMATTVNAQNNQTGLNSKDHLYSAMAIWLSYNDHYSADNYLMRENYPYVEDYKATYLADEDKSEKANPYSYLWPFSSTITAMVSLYEATGDKQILWKMDHDVLPGLKHYYDKKRKPAAYASYINTAKPSDRFYDDNVWLGIDLTDAYLLSGKKKYLGMAKEIWRFIESGIDDQLGGGIYWCEQKKRSKNTCSNAPGSVFALKLYQATNDSHYLEQGKSLYHWTKKNLQDPEDGLYWDNINLRGRVQKWKFAYNSGQMLQSACLLYKITGEQAYLDEAKRLAEACHKHFFSRTAQDEMGELKVLSEGNIWFTAVMMRGFIELYGIDGNKTYLQDFGRNLQMATMKMRDPKTGLYNSDWLGIKKDEVKGLLTQGAMAEMFARMAAVSKSM